MHISLTQNNLCFRALDHKHERSDQKIVRHLASHLKDGPLSRRERYGEMLGRLSSGMFKQKQCDIYVASPLDYPGNLDEIRLREFLDWFDAEHEAAHRAYLILNAPQSIDSYKKRQHVVPDSVPLEQRRIEGLVLRPNLLKTGTFRKIREVMGVNNLPVLDLDGNTL